MTVGLRIRQANGRIDLDSSARVSRILSVFDITAVTGSRTIPGLNSGTPFWQWFPTNRGSIPAVIPKVFVTRSGEVITWRVGLNNGESYGYYLPYRMMVGVY